MSSTDWIVFAGLLLCMIAVGVWRSRHQHHPDGYLRAGQTLSWPMVLLGVMATQASAITFLSAPGQAYTDGMRFVQYYFGLPIAMVVICAVFIPIYRRFNVYTAYEFLEQRFDRRTRVLTSVLFLFSRSISTGLSIYAPSIIISAVFGWNIYLTNLFVGGLLLLYTVRGGAHAVAHTQTLMFIVIMASMLVVAGVLLTTLPEGMTFTNALQIAGANGSLNVITLTADVNDRYNLVAGLIGGFFLALSYFGTDQSQVGRFIAGRSEDESKLGLLLNGIVKIPMQFGILLIGALLVAVYAIVPAPLSFNPTVTSAVRQGALARVHSLEEQWVAVQGRRTDAARAMMKNEPTARDVFRETSAQARSLRAQFQMLAREQGIAESNDANYVFLHFVRTMMPVGLVGLVFAVIIMASWGSISAAMHSLASASVVDLHLVLSDRTVLHLGTATLVKLHTLAWGIVCIGVSMLATRMGSLIEAVNVLGSLFYGPILGIFLVAFFVKQASGKTVVVATIVAEALVLICFASDVVGFLWLNVIGAITVVAWSAVTSAKHWFS